MTRYRRNDSYLAWLAMLPGALAVSYGSLAQEVARSAVAPNALEEVVVTAERRSVDLMSTSLAATVLSEDDLIARQILNLDALQFNTPALSVSNYGQANLLNIRGIGRTEVATNAAAGVPLYRDGVAVFNAYFSSSEPYFDIKSIQVLRGPQGTFAGQNSTGGAVFVTTNDPEPADFGGSAQVQVGNYDQLGARLVLNVPVSETFALRFAGDAERHDSFHNYSGPYTGHPGELERAAGRVGMLWAPTSSFSAVVKVDYDYVDSGANTYAPVASTAPLHDISSNANLFAVDRFVRATANLNYTFGNGTVLRSISGYQDGETEQGSDSDGADVLFDTLDYRATERIVSQEFNLISPDDRRLQYVLGAYYADSSVGIPRFLLAAPPLLIDLVSTLERENVAVFANLNYAVTPKLRVEIGGRFNRASVDQDLLIDLSFAGFPLGSTPGPTTLPDDEKFTGKAGVSYQFNDDHYVFVAASSGYKNSGLNTSVSAPPSFEGETLISYEAGYKARFLENRLGAQLNVYHYDYENYQMTQYDVTSGLAVLSNVPGHTESNGAELQLNARFGATALNFAASWADSKLPTFFTVDPRFPPPPGSPACSAQGPSTTPQCVNLTGRSLPYQPEFTLGAGLEHRFDTGIGSFTPRVDVAYMSDQSTKVFEVPVQDDLEERTVVNAQIAYRTGPWSATLFSTNVLDEEYVVAKVQGSGGLRVAGLPRQVGLRIQREF